MSHGGWRVGGGGIRQVQKIVTYYLNGPIHHFLYSEKGNNLLGLIDFLIVRNENNAIFWQNILTQKLGKANLKI